MKQTPLNQWHRARGATMTDFNGWDMPLFYTGITEEHRHTRTATGLFDLCHMGRIRVTGAGAKPFLDRLTAAKVTQAAPGEVQYSFLLRPDGTTIDDITIYHDETDAMLVVNAGNKERALAWISEQAADVPDVTVEDLSDAWGMVAIQGPGARRVVAALFGALPELDTYYRFVNLADTVAPRAILSTTGYTGEHGYELYLPAEHLPRAWEALMAACPEAHVKPIGLGARDSLRLEAAMPLYGHEWDDTTTPLEAGLGKFVDFDKGDFTGRTALAAVRDSGGPTRRLVGFELVAKGPVARQGFAVHATDVANEDSAPNEKNPSVGIVTSGIHSPTLGKVIGLAYVHPSLATVDTPIFIEIRGCLHPAVVVRRPFYKRSAD